MLLYIVPALMTNEVGRYRLQYGAPGSGRMPYQDGGRAGCRMSLISIDLRVHVCVSARILVCRLMHSYPSATTYVYLVLICLYEAYNYPYIYVYMYL